MSRRCLLPRNRTDDVYLFRSYAQSLIGMNPDVLTADGKVDMNANGNPIMFPTDVAAAVNNGASASSALSSAGISPSASVPVNAAPAASSASAAASQTSAPAANGARGTAVSSALLGAGFLVATFFAL